MPGSAHASTAFRPNFAAVATFEEAAPRYDSSGARLAGPIADHLVSLAGPRPGHQVLDAGCGAGAVSIRSAQAVSPGGQVIGIDLADGMLRRTAAEAAGRGLDNVTVRRGNASRPPFALLERMREPDGSLIRRVEMAYAVAYRPPEGRTGESPAAAGSATAVPRPRKAAGR